MILKARNDCVFNYTMLSEAEIVKTALYDFNNCMSLIYLEEDSYYKLCSMEKKGTVNCLRWLFWRLVRSNDLSTILIAVIVKPFFYSDFNCR